MMKNKNNYSRREFLKKSLFGLGGMVFLANYKPNKLMESLGYLDEYAASEYYLRNAVPLANGTISLWTKPSDESAVIRSLAVDEVLPWNREVIGKSPSGRNNNRWVETPEGYVYQPSIQKVQNFPNQPVSEIPNVNGVTGMWAEVTVPYVKMSLEGTAPLAPWLGGVSSEYWRLYYSQVVWIDQMSIDADGSVYYRINEDLGHGYGYGDIFWADAAAFRPLTDEDVSPIHPDEADKSIVVNVNQQVLSCLEGINEVYFCRVSTGMKYDQYGQPADSWVTPVGDHWIWRKCISLHMSGGTTGAGWDTMAVPWTSLFVGSGVSIHATFWHSDFGTARSHGCVNASAEDAKWIFRWTMPNVALNPGDLTVTDYSGTMVHVKEPTY